MKMFALIYLILSLHYSIVLSLVSNTYVFSGSPNTYIAFDSWRPCLTGYIRFDLRTSISEGTIAYIDDRGKFDFFYLKLLQGKLRLLFNLGNDRQALNVNRELNDDQWHTILIKRLGQMTSLIIDHGLAENSTLTYSEDLYFGGAVHNEYDSSPFYFGGIPSILERPSSGNLSSFDVYMQPRFRGQIRNIIYKNCTDNHLIQPEIREISGGISLISNSNCSNTLCKDGICLINDYNYTCLCDESNSQGENCQSIRSKSELTFFGKEYFKYSFSRKNFLSSTEILTFHFQTNHYDGLLFQLIDSKFYIKFKSGQLVVEYRLNSSWYEILTPKEMNLIDNRWHFVQIQRNHGQIAILIDQIYIQIDNDVRFDQILNFDEIFLGGNSDSNLPKFYGCLKDISLIFNENFTIHFNQSLINLQSYGFFHNKTCQSLINPIQFLTSSSYLTIDLGNFSGEINISFRFETYSSDSILFYSQSLNQEHFLGIDLFDGFLYITININKKKQRKELFQQRFNDGQTHVFQLDIRTIPTGFELNIQIDYRQTTKILLRNSPSKINLQKLTIAGVNPNIRWLPTNFYSGILHRGLIGCFSDLEINHQQINLTEYFHSSNLNHSSRIGPCSIQLSTKRQCLCEHNGECRFNHAGLWTCDCSKTGYTGQRCEQLAYHLDLNDIQLLELNTNIQWSEQINQISFNLHAIHDEETFLQIRSCRSISQCDSIDFSIYNGLLRLNFYRINLTIEYPFLLDNQWHSIDLKRINTSFLLHIDNHIIQQRVDIQSLNISLLSTIWIIFHGNKQILIEDIRLYDQLIYSKLSKQTQLKTRLWKPSNVISFDHQENSYVDIQLNEILCQDCYLNAFYFEFRTIDHDGLLFYAEIQTKLKNSSSSEYLILKFVNGYLNFVILNQIFDESYRIESSSPLNDNDWHHFSFYRTSDYHFQITIDSNEYYLFTSIYFLEKISFGRTISTLILPFLSTLKTCLASLTINSHPINFREYIKPNLHIRNDCSLDSQCPLKSCLNTGQCYDRMQCNCQHTSFQGRFCQILKIGYRFNSSYPGLIFDQPFLKEQSLSNYRISFGIITKMNTSDLIRINDQIWIEIYSNRIRLRLIGNDWLSHHCLINDGFYHLIQIEYHFHGLVYLIVDNQKIFQEIKTKLLFDKPLLLLIGQNPIFKQSFQGELYGLQSDIYSIFDLISPTFQRISYTLKTISSSLPLIYSSIDNENQTCSYQSYDEICLISSEMTSNLLSYTNITFQSYSIPRLTKKIFNSTISYQEIYFHSMNTTRMSDDQPRLIGSIRSPTSSNFLRKYSWQYCLILFLLIFFGIVFCLILMICCCMKYRRKDAGVYELVETQRFRPLSITGDNQFENKNKIYLNKNRKRTKSPLIEINEQREFYI